MKKSNFIQLTALCFILSLTASCGGSNKSGSSGAGAVGSQYNQYTAGDSSILGDRYHWSHESEREAAIRTFNRIIEWRNRTDLNQILSPGFSRGIPVTQNNWQNANCKEWDLWIANPKICWGTSTNTQTQAQFQDVPTQFCTRVENGKIYYNSLVNNQTPYNSYSCSQNADYREYRVEENAEIGKLLSLNNRTWFIHDIYETNGIISVIVGTRQAPGQFGYVIDTRINSLYNPVVIQDIQNGKTIQSLIPGLNF